MIKNIERTELLILKVFICVVHLKYKQTNKSKGGWINRFIIKVREKFKYFVAYHHVISFPVKMDL